jgi:hypothetical protein
LAPRRPTQTTQLHRRMALTLKIHELRKKLENEIIMGGAF